MRTVTYAYRITTRAYGAATRTESWHAILEREQASMRLSNHLLSPWSEGLTYRDYAHTPRGVQRAVNRMLRDFGAEHEPLELLELNAENSPADNLFIPGRTATLDAVLGEQRRIRASWRILNPHSLTTYSRIWITVEKRAFLVDRDWR